MADLDKKNGDDLIGELIAGEEEEALARFRAGHFEDRLRKSLGALPARSSRPPAFRSRLLPVWISAAVLVALGSTALVFLRSRTQAPQSAITVEAALRRLPGIQAIEKQRPGGLDTVPLPGSSLDQSIAAVLSSRVQPGGISPAREPQPVGRSFDADRKPLDLQELYDLLMTNKPIERVLTLVSSKPKEG